jgi:hypothetical protein
MGNGVAAEEEKKLLQRYPVYLFPRLFASAPLPLPFLIYCYLDKNKKYERSMAKVSTSKQK